MFRIATKIDTYTKQYAWFTTIEGAYTYGTNYYSTLRTIPLHLIIAVSKYNIDLLYLLSTLNMSINILIPPIANNNEKLLSLKPHEIVYFTKDVKDYSIARTSRYNENDQTFKYLINPRNISTINQTLIFCEYLIPQIKTINYYNT